MRLIDADKLLKELDQYINPAPNTYYTGFQDGIATAISEIEDAEGVPLTVGNAVCSDCVSQMAAVVRCVECKHSRGWPCGLCYKNTEVCANVKGYKGEVTCVRDDDFCSYGEREAVENKR